MKKITILKEQLVNEFGKPFESFGKNPNQAVYLYVQSLASITEKQKFTGVEKMQGYAMAQNMLKEAVNPFYLETKEAELLIKAVERQDFPAVIHAQLINGIVDSEEMPSGSDVNSEKDEPKQDDAKEEQK